MRYSYILVVLIMLEITINIESSNILCLFTSAHKSHMLVYTALIKSLLNRNHNITVVSVLPVQHLFPRKISVVQIEKPACPYKAFGIFRQIAVIQANSKVLDNPVFKRFLEQDNQFDLVVLGYLYNDYQLGVAAHFKCPIVVVWITQPISFVNRFTGAPNGWSYAPSPFEKNQNAELRGVLYGIFETIFRWTTDFIMEEAYRQLFPSTNYPSLENMRKNVSLVLCNHHFSEGPITANMPSSIEISGIQINNNISVSKELEDFMNGADKGVIYFSLGTVVSAKQLKMSTLDIFVKVFSTLPQRVIWKIESLPQNFSNILISKWLPQNRILAHPNTKLFITHGGKGSVTEALYYAVPMIAIPMFGDQFGNAYRLDRKNIGFKLDANAITEESFRKHIFQILYNSTYSDNIKVASEIYRDRPLSVEETAIYWIEYVIRYRGASHLQTIAKDMSLIQYLNIDIYFFCFCFLCAVIAALKIIAFFTCEYLQDLAKFVSHRVKVCFKNILPI